MYVMHAGYMIILYFFMYLMPPQHCNTESLLSVRVKVIKQLKNINVWK